MGSVVPKTVVVKLCQLDINWSSKEFFCFQSKFVSFQEKLLSDVARHALTDCSAASETFARYFHNTAQFYADQKIYGDGIEIEIPWKLEIYVIPL